MRQFVTFNVDDHQFGIEILYVRELNQISDVTNVELAPHYIAGLLNLRGQVVTLFDVGKRLGYESSTTIDKSYNIILKTDSELASIRTHEGRDDLKSSEDMAGLLVDAFGDVVEVDDDRIEPPPANISENEKRFMAGIVRAGTSLFTILDVSKLLLSDEGLNQEASALSP